MNGIVKINPIFGNNDIFNIVDEVFNKSIGDIINNDVIRSKPQINIKENDKMYIMEVAAPGLSKEAFSLKVEEGYIIISAENKSDVTEEKEDYKKREFNYSSFERRYLLPETVDMDSINAKYENGILSIDLPKMEVKVEKGKVIEIV
jgi:HSP20 family protein